MPVHNFDLPQFIDYVLEVLEREAVDGAPQRAPHGGDDDGVERSEAEVED